MHHRFSPKQHRFHYNVFMFYIDLDEIELLRKKLLLFSYNRFNFFNFKDNEHIQLPAENPDKTKSTKQHVITYLNQNGINFIDGKIMLLTNLNVLGYNFNPVSFYFCFDKSEKPVAAVAEVSNTFREMKLYFLGGDTFDNNIFRLNTKKYFYVSPFIDHDANFDFNLNVPDNKLNIRIDDYKEKTRFFISTLTGVKKILNNRILFWYSLRFPFLTLRIIALIHWNALLLWIKKIHYHKKSEFNDLQKDVLNKYKD